MTSFWVNRILGISKVIISIVTTNGWFSFLPSPSRLSFLYSSISPSLLLLLFSSLPLSPFLYASSPLLPPLLLSPWFSPSGFPQSRGPYLPSGGCCLAAWGCRPALVSLSLPSLWVQADLSTFQLPVFTGQSISKPSGTVQGGCLLHGAPSSVFTWWPLAEGRSLAQPACLCRPSPERHAVWTPGPQSLLGGRPGTRLLQPLVLALSSLRSPGSAWALLSFGAAMPILCTFSHSDVLT